MADQTFNIRVDGLAELTARLSKAPAIVKPILQQAINKSSKVLDSHRVDPTNVPWRTGELARRWTTTYDMLLLKTKPDVRYARVVQYGKEIAQATTFHRTSAFGRPTAPYSFTMQWPTFSGRHFMEKIRAASTDEIRLIFRNALAAVTQALQ